MLVTRPLLVYLTLASWAVPSVGQQKLTSDIPPAGNLRILVLEGQGAINTPRAPCAAPPIIEVRDANDIPVEGADVTFEMPPAGPGGAFTGGERTFATRSNSQGQAVSSGFVTNDQQGRFTIRAVARRGSDVGRTLIMQTNQTVASSRAGAASGKSLKKWILLGAIGAVGLTATLAATHTGSGSTTAPQVTIVPGPISIGGPK